MLLHEDGIVTLKISLNFYIHYHLKYQTM